MKLASFTDNSQSFLKYGDTNTFLHVQISEDGTFVDLTQAVEVNVPVANDDGLLFTKTIDPTKLANGDSGIVDINFTSDDQNNLPPDDYYLEIWVTNHDGTIGIYPADENQLMFTITDNLTLITGDVVPAVAFDDFQNMFNTLQQQVHDAIANGLKGDKGDKGDTGEGLDIKGRVDSVSELPTTANEGNGYLVNEELYVWTNGAWKDCGSIQGPQGIQGIQGKTGNGISSTTIQYQISNNATTAPTGTWSNTLIATTQVNPFLWTKVTLNYDDGTSKSFYLVSSKGDKGDKGDRGNQIFNGRQYAPNTSGYWWSDLTPTPSVDNPPKIGDTIITPNGDILQIDTIVVGGAMKGGGTFGVGNVLENIKGATGQQGPVGAGLVVKGTVSNASQLPTTGNQEGYCYFVGTDLYVWDAGAWKNCGSVSPDLSNYVTVTDLNNGLSTKVTDNGNGTIKVNGTQVSPYNKLSDTIGGRNLLINTAQLNDSTVCLANLSNISDTYLGLNIFQTANQWTGVKIYWSYLAPKLKTNTNYIMSEYVRNTSPTTSVSIGLYGEDSGVVLNSKSGGFATLPPNSGWTRISALVNIASYPHTFTANRINVLRFENCTTLTDGYVQFAGLKLEQGSIATDWTPAPEDKQDKIGYTPADDSKVVHDNHDGTEQLDGVQVQPYNKLSDAIGGRNLWSVSQSDFGYFSLSSNSLVTTKNGDFNKYRKDMIATNGAKYISVRHTGDIPSNLMPGASGRIVAFDKDQKFISPILQPKPDADYFAVAEIPENTVYVLLNIVWGDSGETMIQFGNQKTDWTPAPEDKADDSKVVHTSDMRKPANDVVGLEDVPQAVVHSALASGVDLNTILTPGVYPFKAVSFINFINKAIYWGYLVVTSEGQMITQEFHNAGPGMPFYRTQYGYPTSWSPWGKMAEDFKVAHLSGANNFDTVPTVNNNPLLLASSLPSDLARTTKDANFTGKLQKSGIDVATKSDVTTAINTATANMVDSSKPTNFTDNVTFANTPKMSNGDPLITASQTGDVSKLLTKDKSSYVSAINELSSIVDRFYPVASQAIPTDNVSYSNQGLVYNYDPSNNTVIFRKNDPSYSIKYDTSVVGTNFTENAGGAAPLGGIRIYFGFKAIHYINGTEGTLSDINYYVLGPTSTAKSGELGLLKGIPYYLTSENFAVGTNYTIDFSGNGMNLSTSGNNRISPRLIISNKGNGVLSVTPYHGEDFKDDKTEGYWIYPYITKMVSYSVDSTAMKALPNGYSYEYVKDANPSITGNYLVAWGQGSYQYKFDLNNLGNGYSIDSMGSSITINVSIKGTDSSYIGYHTGDGYKSSQFPNNTLTTNNGDVDGYADRSSLGKSYINLLLKLSKEDVISGSSYTAYYQVLSSNYGGAVFYAIKLVINNDNTISIYAITPFFTSNTSVFNPSQTVSVNRNYSSSTTISIVNNV